MLAFKFHLLLGLRSVQYCQKRRTNLSRSKSASSGGRCAENGGDRAEKALGELIERIEDAEVIEPHGQHPRESLLGLDVPYKAPPPAGKQQQNRDGGRIGQQSKSGENGGGI
ncbi:hypothetical protein GPALN_002203 [Globodera pallida]|nr:hypothetical protein GPALN_002203 [Globodera pallida]